MPAGSPIPAGIFQANKNRQDRSCRFLCGSGVLDGLRECDGRVRHTVGEAPLVVVPGQDAHELAFHDLRLVDREDRGMACLLYTSPSPRDS